MKYTVALVVEDASLRSMLVGRLTLGGADIVTASDLDDRRIISQKDSSLLLVTDDKTLSEEGGCIERLFADPRWARVVIVGAWPDTVTNNARIVRLSPASAASEIVAMLG